MVSLVAHSKLCLNWEDYVQTVMRNITRNRTPRFIEKVLVRCLLYKVSVYTVISEFGFALLYTSLRYPNACAYLFKCYVIYHVPLFNSTASDLGDCQCHHVALHTASIKNWRREQPGNEASQRAYSYGLISYPGQPGIVYETAKKLRDWNSPRPPA